MERILTHCPSANRLKKSALCSKAPKIRSSTDKVWHELAFGLESLGYDTPTIRRRVAEMASFFGHPDVVL